MRQFHKLRGRECESLRHYQMAPYGVGEGGSCGLQGIVGLTEVPKPVEARHLFLEFPLTKVVSTS